jgi:2,4-dienoyl-CoA reductase-like NADH-dependent reductase (Old Yellow Enzyme family)
MSKLFAPGEINGLKLKNRFVRSATLEGMAAVDGTCTPRLTEFMAGLARGGDNRVFTVLGNDQLQGEDQKWKT